MRHTSPVLLRRLAIPIAALALIFFSARAHAQKPSRFEQSEQASLKKIAGEWVKLGDWCVAKKLGTEARLCADRAKAADATAKGLDKLVEKATDCEDAASDADRKEWEKKLASTGKTVAGCYDQLMLAGAKEKDAKVAERLDRYFLTALALAPSDSRWGVTLKVVAESAKKKDFDRVARITEGALALNPPEKTAAQLKTALDDVAADRVILKGVPTHPIKYFFSLPRGYKRAKDKKWPVLVCVDGAGSNFEGIAKGYKEKQGKLPFIIVSPCTFSNTNKIEGDMVEKYRKFYTDKVIEEGNGKRIDWDEEGVLAILKDLEANYDAENRVYVTGFSGGGNVTYMMVFKHPNLVNAAAPSCANFGAISYGSLKEQFTEEDRNFPVHLITGEKDPHRDFTFGDKSSPGIEPQTDWAEKLLKELGYPNYKRMMVPGMGHDTGYDHVIATFKPYLEGKKKRGDKLQ
ncbi:MAG: alpha/beta hydrolase-fold protein [Planctomycetota bacterium]|nr:alpha/beta hydrolase-fold protein [Planctomycetota bacterium]